MDINKILSKWYKYKQQQEELERKIKICREKVIKEMEHLHTDTISKNGYTVTKRRNTRTTISKESLPKDLWNQYSTRLTYDSYHLSKAL